MNMCCVCGGGKSWLITAVLSLNSGVAYSDVQDTKIETKSNNRSIVHYSKKFFRNGEKTITSNFISSTTVCALSGYFGYSIERFYNPNKNGLIQCVVNDNVPYYVKNVYELLRIALSFSFYNKYWVKKTFGLVLKCDVLSDTFLRDDDNKINLDSKKNISCGADKIGILSASFGMCWKYYEFKNGLTLGGCFTVGGVWCRDWAMNIRNYTLKHEAFGNITPYLSSNQILIVDVANNIICTLRGLAAGQCFLYPFSPATLMHFDITFDIGILSVQYKKWYVCVNWKRGIIDTYRVIKNKKWNYLPSTFTISIGYNLEHNNKQTDIKKSYDIFKYLLVKT